jgi:hypothetical protein
VAWPLSARPTLRTVDYEADQAAQVLVDPDVVVVPIVAVHGAQVPWARWSHKACPWWQPSAYQACFASSRRCWPERVAWLADQARIRFHAAA